ncbi:lysophospholipid acyltransferase family protein [Pseudomonadales bacterium]|nr:lysophospholipid acyltransferase family protein [Pseudomonadales bacterium]
MKILIVTWLLKLVGLLPLPVARAIAKGIADLLSLANNNIYRLSRINIALTHPQLSGDALDKITKDSVASTVINAFEMPIVWQQDNDWIIKRTVSIEGEEYLTSVINRGKGVIVIAPHIGNWEVLGRHLPTHAPTTNLYQPPKLKALENIVRNGRERSGAKLVPTNQRGVAALLKALRRGELIGVLPDQVPPKNSGVFAPFYDVPAYTMTLVYSLIQKTGCRVVLGSALRVDGGFKVIYSEAPEAIYSADQAVSLRALNLMVETAINNDVAQYQWAYKRFKMQPEGVEKPY